MRRREEAILDRPGESARTDRLTADDIEAFATESDPFAPQVDEAAAARCA